VAAGNGGGLTWKSTVPDFAFDLNTFQGNQAALGPAVYNSRTTSTAPVAAAQNYWGTSDLNQVESDIYHFNDSAALGLVNYNPILLAPVQASPTLTANYPQVPPGSRINLTVRNVQASSSFSVVVDGVSLGTVTSDAYGQIVFTLVTSASTAEGSYVVSIRPLTGLLRAEAATAASASQRIILSNQAPFQAQAADLGPAIVMPETVQPNFLLHLPFLSR